MFKFKKRNFILTGIFTILLLPASGYTAKITGKVIYEGEKPKLREINMEADPICLTKHDAPVLPQTITLGPNNELANVFLYIAKGLPNQQWPVSTEPVVLDQKGCMYDPAVFGVMVGQPVKILNPDGTLHNVHALSKINPEFNLAMPKFRQETTKIFEKAEMWFQMKCDVHPWMVTYANVMEHPFFAVSDKEGHFTIDNLPAGEYVLEARQQRLDTQQVTVSLGADETKEVNLTFSRPE